MTTIEQIINNSRLSTVAQHELKNAFTTQGKRKGLIKKSTPAKGKTGHIAWQCVIGVVAPVRMSFSSLLFMDDTTRTLHDEIEAWVEEPRVRIWLNARGQRPFEFNLYAHSYDVKHDVYQKLEDELVGVTK